MSLPRSTRCLALSADSWPRRRPRSSDRYEDQGARDLLNSPQLNGHSSPSLVQISSSMPSVRWKRHGYDRRKRVRSTPQLDPDSLELAPGTEHQNLEGWVASSGQRRRSIGRAGESIRLSRRRHHHAARMAQWSKATSSIAGQAHSLEQSWVQPFPVRFDRRSAPSPTARLRGLTFTGKDRAAGASWEAWVKKWNEKKAAGEKGLVCILKHWITQDEASPPE